MSFLESGIVMVFWTILNLFFDLIITAVLTGAEIFHRSAYWWGFVVIYAAVFVFHKKKHIYIRHLGH